MSNSTFVRVTAPGLPLSPALFFDPEGNRAMVTTWLPTWRSWGCAYVATSLLHWLAGIWSAYWLWTRLAFLDDPVMRGGFVVLAFGCSYAITKPFIHGILDGFLARQVFSAKTTFWFTPEVIAFRSRLYEHGVRVERKWRQSPISVRYDVSQDVEAADAGHVASRFAAHVQRRRQSACVLRLILGVSSSHRLATANQEAPLQRALPICELDQRDAPRISTVMMAASALTSKQTEYSTARYSGVDIDLDGS